jgi:16S rRNA processing protein RimM
MCGKFQDFQGGSCLETEVSKQLYCIQMKDSCLRSVFTLGVVGRPHGVRGFLRVHSLSGETAHFRALAVVTLYAADGREQVFPVEECRPAGRDLLMKLRGITSPEEAACYRAWEIRAAREYACPLKEGEYYTADLRGCALVCGAKAAGTVRAVIETGAHELLEVVDAKGKTFFIPFVEAHVGRVDIISRSIELKSEWLLE